MSTLCAPIETKASAPTKQICPTCKGQKCIMHEGHCMNAAICNTCFGVGEIPLIKSEKTLPPIVKKHWYY